MPHPPPSENNVKRIEKMVASYNAKSGTSKHPDAKVTESVVLGLARHLDTLGRPLCPCRYYPDKTEEIKHRTWICPCDDMNVYKYCHCLLFTTPEGLPVTEYLPEDHEGRAIYGLVKDPTPGQGRVLQAKAAEREAERKARPS
ncbi:MAG: ferredoxin:thioredoxin reductase [Planctomycetota bacterium]|nr:ferredoxin:thioredoxin reductase [Planctomycetota bacterium]